MRNNSLSPVTVNSVTLRIGSCRLTYPRPGHRLQSANLLIEAQAASGSVEGCHPKTGWMDTSDVSPGAYCVPSSLIPLVTVTVDQIPYSYPDDGKVLTTGGVDGASCSSRHNESHPWRQLSLPALGIREPSLLPDGAVGTDYSVTLAGINVRVPNCWASKPRGLPPGLGFDRCTGHFLGIPASAGTYSFNVTLTDATQRATKHFAVTILGAPLLGSSAEFKWSDIAKFLIEFTAALSILTAFGLAIRWSLTKRSVTEPNGAHEGATAGGGAVSAGDVVGGLPDERLKLIYDESVRAITQQAGSLDELRVRAGTIFSGASVAAGFLGGAQFIAHRNLAGAAWVGVGGYVATGVLTVLVLAPQGLILLKRGSWTFVHSAKMMIAKYVDGEPPSDINRMCREAALENERYFHSNQWNLDRLGKVLSFASVALVVEIVGFLINLRG